MSRRALLSPDQRIRLFGIPVDQAEMARHYVLSVEDLALVRAKRRVSSRLGFAVQLCVLRYTGSSARPGYRWKRRRCRCSHLLQSRSALTPGDSAITLV